MSCRVSKGRRTTNGRRSLKLRLFGFKQSCFPQAVKKEIELGYNVICAGGIVNSCCRCDGSRRTSRSLRTGLAPWTFWALGALWAGCSLWASCSCFAYRPLGSLRSCSPGLSCRPLWSLRSCSSCLSCRPGGSRLTLGPRGPGGPIGPGLPVQPQPGLHGSGLHPPGPQPSGPPFPGLPLHGPQFPPLPPSGPQQPGHLPNSFLPSRSSKHIFRLLSNSIFIHLPSL